MNSTATQIAICPNCGHDAISVVECVSSRVYLHACQECGWESKPLTKARDHTRYLSQAAADYAKSKAR